MVKKLFVAFSTLAFLAGNTLAQDAKTVLQNATQAMGNVKSIQFSGTGHLSAVGQAWNPSSPWPETIVKSYTKTLDYGSQAAREELVRNEGDPPAKGGAAPFGGDQRQVNLVSGQYAWNQPGNAPQPAIAAAEERQLQIWLTPHGFLNGAMQNNATAKRGKGGTEVTFTAMNKFKVTGTIDSQNMVTKTEALFPNPVLGDMLIETTYSGYKDFNGVKFPTMIVQKQGGYPWLDLAVTDVKASVPLDLPVPDAVKNAKAPPVVVQSQKLGDGLWWLGGGSHHSVVVEYPNYITVIESPLTDERAVAVIAEAKKLVPNKPIKYLVNTHNHFDHLGGVRGFLAEGNITLITQAMNKPYYEKIFKAPHTLAPDRLSQNPKKVTYITVTDKYVLSDGGREIDIIHLGDNHNEGMLVVYIPKEKVLVEADAFTPPAPNGPPPAPRALAFTKNLNANIERLKLDVVTIAPLHGFVVPVADLKKLAGTT